MGRKKTPAELERDIAEAIRIHGADSDAHSKAWNARTEAEHEALMAQRAAAKPKPRPSVRLPPARQSYDPDPPPPWSQRET